jgi:sugar lactone lactonase YvrE
MKSLAVALYACALLLAQAGNAEPYEVVTISGSSTQRVSLDGTNLQARFHTPRHSVLAPDGSIFVADDCVIRKLSRSGTNWIVTTIAGAAGQRSHLDGTNQFARFRIASGIVMDSSQSLFVADYGSHTIRKLTPDGTNWIVTTIAGIPNDQGTANGLGGAAQFNNPFGMAIDGDGNLFVADTSNEMIRRIMPSGTNWVVSTVAGAPGQRGSADGTNSVARFRQPRCVAVDASGNLFVTDRENSTVRQITAAGSNWVVQTIAGTALSKGSDDGDGSSARFSAPNGIALTAAGHLVVSDTESNTLRLLVPNNGVWTVSTIAGLAGSSGAGDGIGSAARFNYPDDVQADTDGFLYVCDRDNFLFRSVKLVNPTLKISKMNGEFILRWPLAYAGFTLESSAEVAGQIWNLVAAPTGIDVRYWAVTNAAGVNQEFFRLRRP